MRHRIYLISIFCVILFNISYGQDNKIYKEISTLTKQETSMFERVKKISQEFAYSNKVIRYYNFDSKFKYKKQLLVEMLFDDVYGIILDKYIEYSVVFEPNSRIFEQTITQGNAYQSYNTVFVGEKSIIDVTSVCGKFACGVIISNNGTKIIELNE